VEEASTFHHGAGLYTSRASAVSAHHRSPLPRCKFVSASGASRRLSE
jgi:hypothetical protein